MPHLFLTCANSHSQKDFLPGLQEEDDKTYSILSPREKKGRYRLIRDSRISPGKIIEHLQRH